MMKEGDRRLKCVIINKIKDKHGNPVGKRYSNPLLDTREYILQMPDGSTEQYTANAVAENLYSDIDNFGHTFTILNELIGHEKDSTALSKKLSTYSTKANRVRHKPTTKGWRILVDWRDGTSS